MKLLFVFIPGLVFLASLLSLGRFGLSTKRSLFIFILSLVVALLSFFFGQKAYLAADRSGDASALTAAFLVAFFGIGPAAGTVCLWLAVAFSKAFTKANLRN